LQLKQTAIALGVRFRISNDGIVLIFTISSFLVWSTSSHRIHNQIVHRGLSLQRTRRGGYSESRILIWSI
jgi:hypothetical protein